MLYINIYLGCIPTIVISWRGEGIFRITTFESLLLRIYLDLFSKFDKRKDHRVFLKQKVVEIVKNIA